MTDFMMDVKRGAMGIAIDQILKYVDKDREKNLLNLVDVTQKIAGNMFLPESYDGARELIRENGKCCLLYTSDAADD